MTASSEHALRPPSSGPDFVAVPGGPDCLTFGVGRRQIGNGPTQTLGAMVSRRLCPGKAVDLTARWVPTCYRWDVLLPPNAMDECIDPQRLCEIYEQQAFAGLKDLVIMATLRFPDPDRLHHVWERVRIFARERMCAQRHLAVVTVMHLPVTIGSTNPPHIHLMMPARQLRSFGFGEFVRPFASDRGKQILADELAQALPEFAA